jgi:hypothetical protein
MNNHNHRVSIIENPSMYVPIRHPSTTVENPLQIDLFMQNKPNVKYAQIIVKSYIKSKYEIMDTWLSGKNKPKTNPNKANLPERKIDAKCVFTTDYRKKDDFLVRINKPNLVKGPK